MNNPPERMTPGGFIPAKILCNPMLILVLRKYHVCPPD